MSRRRWMAAAAVMFALSAVAGLVRARAGVSQTAPAMRQDLSVEVEVTGTLEAVDAASLGPPATDRMYQYKIAMLVPEGTEVRAGQPVLGFDTSELMQALEQARTEADSARARLEQRRVEVRVAEADARLELAEAEAALRRAQLKNAVPSELVAGVELADARLELEIARTRAQSLATRTETAEAAAAAELRGLASLAEEAAQAVQELEATIASMTVRAPRSGVVIHLRDWRGERKKQGDTCWRGEAVLQVPDLNHMKAQGEVEEAQSGLVQAGQVVKLRLDAHPDHEYLARVADVSRVVRRKSWRNPRRIVRLELELERSDPERMRPGMRFVGDIEVDHVAGALTIPVACVGTGEAGPVVRVPGAAGPRTVDVRLGRQIGELVEVLDGLVEGDLVVIASDAARSAGSS